MTHATAMRHLEHRSNDAHDTILLVEDGTVIGEWMTAGDVAPHDQVFANYLLPGDLDHWDETYPDCTDPSEYGVALSSRTC